MKKSLASFLDRFCRWLRDVLSDDGNQSTMRLVMLLSWTCVLLVWTGLSFSQGKMVEIPQVIMELVGIPTVGKMWQNHLEAKRQPPVDTPPGA